MALNLTFASLGFFVFEVSDRGCSVVAAPRVKKHGCTLAVYGDIAWSTVDGLSKSGDEIALLDCTLSFGTASASAPAKVSQFEMITNFGALACGARIKSNWRKAESDNVLVEVELAGGQVTAYPDDYTCRQRWKWMDCNGFQATQRITSLTVYEPLDWQGQLVFTAKKDKKDGIRGTVQFGSKAWVGLRHTPEADEQDPEKIDKAHASATKKLCDPKGASIIFPERVCDVADIRKAQLPGDLATFLGLGKNNEPCQAKGSIRFKGRPNCSARLMYLAVQDTGATGEIGRSSRSPQPRQAAKGRKTTAIKK